MDKKKLVSDRLKMVHRLVEFNETLADPQKIETTELGWDHIYGGQDALVNYLLLTCFDVLGSAEEWMDFGSWLRSSGTRAERDDALKGLTDAADPAASARHLLESYNRSYGVRRGFFRFIDNLPDADRNELLGSVHIYRDNSSPEIEDVKKKKDFLFSVRNVFTHEAIAQGQLWRVLAGYTAVLDRTGGFKYGYNELSGVPRNFRTDC